LYFIDHLNPGLEGKLGKGRLNVLRALREQKSRERMGLSNSDLRSVAGFVRKATKALNAETIILEAFQVLKTIARIDRLQVVYSPLPGRWTEWKSSPDELEVHSHDEWPAPEKRVAAAFFDPEDEYAGFIAARSRGGKARDALELVAPGIWSSLLLRAALDRVQKAGSLETELARATLRARDEERRHIARELHDDLGQSLASLKLALKWAEDRVRAGRRSAEVTHEISKAREDVGVMLDKLRDLSHTLYPRILDTLGFVPALKELAHQATRFSQIRVECTTQGKSRRLQSETEITLYRCCQEAMNNALRHSGASKLIVHVRFAQREVRVTVEDNGKGFDPRALYGSNSRVMSSGFWTIRQRMADICAAFRVSTAEGHGTAVELIVPYSSREVHDKRKNKTTHRG